MICDAMESNGKQWKAMESNGMQGKAMEWNARESNGMQWKAMESNGKNPGRAAQTSLSIGKTLLQIDQIWNKRTNI